MVKLDLGRVAQSVVMNVAGELLSGGEDASRALRRAAGAGAHGLAKHAAAEVIDLALARIAARAAGTGLRAGAGAAAGVSASAGAGAAGVAATAGAAAVEAPVMAMAATSLAARSGGALAGTATREVVRIGARQAMRSAVRASAIGAVAGLLVEQAIDSLRLARGEIDRDAYGLRTVENVAGAAGGFGGACAGAALGTAILPGPGTVVGGIAGGLCGALGATRGLREIIARRTAARLATAPALHEPAVLLS